MLLDTIINLLNRIAVLVSEFLEIFLMFVQFFFVDFKKNAIYNSEGER